MKKDKGFTLIEFIIYISIVVVLLVVTTNFCWNIIYGNIKSQAIREVQQNARFSMERITRNIEQAAGINSPASGDSANFLSLQMSDPNLDPTVFDVSDGKLRITQGTNGPYNLTNERVEVTNPQFTNLSYPDTPGILKIEMTINHINPTGQSEYDVSFPFSSSASLRTGVEPLVSGWYHQNWFYRKRITILASQVAADLISFPLLVSTIDSDLTKAKNNGDDILFTLSDGTTKISHEIEKYLNSTGELVAWVNISSLSSTQDTEIYMYYGNSGASNQQNPTAVWDSDYVGVWHLSEVSGGWGAIKDSTSNSNNGTDYGTPTFGAFGRIGNAIDFDGYNDHIAVPDNISLRLATGFTIEAWINIDTWGNWENIIFKGGGAGDNSDYQFALVNNGLAWDGTYGGAWRTKYFPTSQDLGTWIYAILTHDTTNVRCYRDGTEMTGSSPQLDPGLIYESNYQLAISREGSSARGYVDGTVDEVRISKTVRPPGWIETQYNNQDNPSGFYSMGIEESSP